MIDVIINAFLQLKRRAEGVDRAKLVETFVDVGPLFTVLSTTDHQIIYGRRGTGKTHALLYLAETLQAKNGIPIYIDLRTVGSTGGIYSDPQYPLQERATRLLVDTLAGLHGGLFDFVVDQNLNLAQLGPLLDSFAEAMTQVVVVGSVEEQDKLSTQRLAKTSADLELRVGMKGIGVDISAGESKEADAKHQAQITRKGIPQARLQFGQVGQVLKKITQALENKRIWLILDEWSAVPLDLQPFLADLLRRSVFPSSGITVKIAAIEQRSQFMLSNNQTDYIGIEIGADASADLNLDDIMVFENDSRKATDFFQDLLYKHYSSVDGLDFTKGPQTSSQLIQEAFTQRNAFEEFVRASEGVPRDFVNILNIAAQKSVSNPISIPIIRTAAKLWYQRDKEAAVSANHNARSLLHWIIDQVIGHRRARAFLLRSGVRNDLIDALFDSRVLHLLKRNIAAHDQPGVRYDVYKLDYGCYVDLLSTAKSPEGLLEMDVDENEAPRYLDVPPDDYRAIRRAILDLDRFIAAGG